MTLIERIQRLDVLYLRWDRAWMRWHRSRTRINRALERRAYRKYLALVGDKRWQIMDSVPKDSAREAR